jgi:4-diphosphocytidyl-2-C-methyl-D-erythritol kinase
MEKITINCPAKINLSLDVVGKKDNGYHLLETIMQNVDLFDEVTVKKSVEGINLYCKLAQVPCNESNTAYKAAKLIKDRYDIKSGIDIIIEKRIPIAAGLAGGSADAAGVIKAMNELFALNITLKDMMEIGVKVGADVPFCLLQCTAFAEGIGEILTPLKPLDGVWCVLAKPNISISTQEVYSKLKIDKIIKHPNTHEIKECIDKMDIEGIALKMTNVLEAVTIDENPVIQELKNLMMEFHALGSLMSGSGPTTFGLFRDKASAEECYSKLRDSFEEVYLVKTYNNV